MRGKDYTLLRPCHLGVPPLARRRRGLGVPAWPWCRPAVAGRREVSGGRGGASVFGRGESVRGLRRHRRRAPSWDGARRTKVTYQVVTEVVLRSCGVDETLEVRQLAAEGSKMTKVLAVAASKTTTAVLAGILAGFTLVYIWVR